MTVLRGDRPLLIRSGESLNALTNPLLFLSRNSRTMNASGARGVTLETVNKDARRVAAYLPFCMENDQPSNEFRRHIAREQIDSQNLGCDRYDAARFVDILPKIFRTNGRLNGKLYLSFAGVS